MRHFTRSLVVLVVVFSGACGDERAGPGERTGPREQAYVFTLDGKPFTPEIVCVLGEPASPQPGDLIRVGRLLLTLGPERDCHFVSTPQEDGRLLLQTDGGESRVVGASIGWSFRGEEKTIFDPLARLSPDEIRGLWGICLDEWPEGVAGKLKQADPARTCIVLTDNAAQDPEGKMPSLPPEIQYLAVDEHSNTGIRDYQALQDLRALRFLVVRAMAAEAFDARLIARNRSLRSLEIKTRSLRHPEALAELEHVQRLDLARVADLATVEFARTMRQLRRLDVTRTAVGDLSPLAGLEKLEEVVASMCPVVKLPDRLMPALRRLEVFSTRLSEPTVASFARLNPGCTVLFRWDEAFRRAVAGTTRIRVRSGGTCHRRPDAEKTLFEVTKDAKIREIVDHVRVDEQRSGFHCMCCGEPSFEFYAGERLVATLGFHHGRSVRWPDRWPGDGMLTSQSADYLARWLSENGVKGPVREREDEEGREQAMKRRSARYMELLPAKVLGGLRSAKSATEAIAAFESGVPDRVDRALLYLRLFGCDQASWNLYAGLDDPVQKELLPKVDQKTLLAAIRKGLGDPAAVNGAARWVLWEGKAELLGPAIEEVLPALAKSGLSHPRGENRRHTLLALGSLKSPAAIRALRDCLAGKIAARELPSGEESEPGGMVMFKPRKFPELEKCSDRVCAAFLLAQAGDKESLPAIRALLATATPKEREVLQPAIAALERVNQ